jgi:nitrate/TMAO reductase-like tetraheme cytochrome c subunit
MSRKFMQFITTAFILVGLLALSQVTQAQSPTPSAYNRPDYNYSESSSCVSCHFIRGAAGADHNLEAVGIMYNDTTKNFYLTGGGWRASMHAQSNYKSTQNTNCAKCHSPLQATAAAAFKPGASQPIPDGMVEGVTCAACHPAHNSVQPYGPLARRLGVYQFGMDRNTPDAYDVVKEGDEDRLCLNCHEKRHNEGNAAFDLMYVAGVRCIDCHMAPYGAMAANPAIEKRAHDFKVAKNLPYSCGVEGSVIHCHPEFNAEATAAFIPYMKEQHKEMWVRDKATKKLNTAADYLKLWKKLQAETQNPAQ